MSQDNNVTVTFPNESHRTETMSQGQFKQLQAQMEGLTPTGTCPDCGPYRLRRFKEWVAPQDCRHACRYDHNLGPQRSIVQNNLLTRPGYTPYCGAARCTQGMPRTTWNGEQFACKCGWRSSFPPEFIQEYKQFLENKEGSCLS